MSAGAKHYAEAERLADLADERTMTNPPLADRLTALAQVHVLLALTAALGRYDETDDGGAR